MQAEIEELREALRDHDVLRESNDSVWEELDNQRMGATKERQRADDATAQLRMEAKETHVSKALLNSRTRDVDAIKELEQGEQNSVKELTQRVKAAESSMLRKAREIAELTKKLDHFEEAFKESPNDTLGLRKTIDTPASRIQKDGSEHTSLRVS